MHGPACRNVDANTRRDLPRTERTERRVERLFEDQTSRRPKHTITARPSVVHHAGARCQQQQRSIGALVHVGHRNPLELRRPLQTTALRRHRDEPFDTRHEQRRPEKRQRGRLSGKELRELQTLQREGAASQVPHHQPARGAQHDRIVGAADHASDHRRLVCLGPLQRSKSEQAERPAGRPTQHGYCRQKFSLPPRMPPPVSKAPAGHATTKL